VADLLGYGSATDFEGSGGATGLSNTTSALRAGDGCTDTDVNSSDFAGATPAPRNSATTAAPCSGEPPPPPGDSASASAGVDIDIESVLSIALERQNISFGNAMAGDSPAAVSERVTVSNTNAAGYALTVHRSAFQPADLPLGMTASAPSGGTIGAQLAGGAKAAIPIAPAADLLIGTTSARSATGGDAWPTNVSFTSPLPVVPPGKYTATLTYTVIGR
jgi:hypothetical protein